jgi:hypothetical protein
MNDNRANRHLTDFFGFVRQLNRSAHPSFIIHKVPLFPLNSYCYITI